MNEDVITNFPTSYPAYQQTDPAALALYAGFGIVYLIVILAWYIYMSICLMKIAEKAHVANGWWAWIPILNILLMLKIAGKPLWWALAILLVVIPLIGALIFIVIYVVVWMKIAEAVHKPNWWGIMMIIPFANFVAPGYLAFSKD